MGKSLNSDSCKSAFAEASRRERRTCASLPDADGAARSYHFYGAYQRFNFNNVSTGSTP